MGKKYLVVHNTCGIAHREGMTNIETRLPCHENTDHYILGIKSILHQKFDGEFDVINSNCMGTEESREALLFHFKDKIMFNMVNENQPVNVTFNQSCRLATEINGLYDAYIYVDSGVVLEKADHLQAISDMYDEYPDSGLVSLLSENDNGSEQWHVPITPGRTVVPVGQALNLHVMSWTKEMYTAFGGKLMPDIFRAYCTESTFSFLAAAVKKKWVAVTDSRVIHKKGMDMGSSGFRTKHPWDDLYLVPYSVLDVCAKGHPLGLGYEECQRICMHDVTKYDDNGFIMDNGELANFIKEELFLKPEYLDYDKIKYEFIR